MRTALVLFVLFVSLAVAAPAEAARCTPVLADGGVVLGREAGGPWQICGSGLTVETRGRPIRFLSNGYVAAAAFKQRKGRTVVRLVRLRDRQWDSDYAVLETRERIVRPALRDDALWFGVEGRRPAIRALGRWAGTLDEHTGVDPRSLRVGRKRVAWDVRGVRRRITTRMRELAPATCTAPPWADAPRRQGSVLTYDVRLGTEGDGAIWGCADGVPPRIVASYGALTGDTPHVVAARAPLVLVHRAASANGPGASLQVVNLATGAPGPETGIGAVRLSAAEITGSGAVAFTSRDDVDHAVATVRVLEATGLRTLDEGVAIDTESLRLDGTHLSWIKGGQPQGAELP